ncbi:MAG TPA: methyltransferase [Acidimicrobiales bacterium]|nr:methyltransferase [Acidimicrobiales bacterium]
MGDEGYLLDNRSDGAADRLVALGTLFDPGTCRRVEALGIRPGWRCWEVGAGGGAVARWLAARVGATGRVLATDIEVSAALADDPAVEIRRHDVGRDGPPGESFDLVHARLVLVHVVGRDQALRTMVEALRPGGWLLVEDADPALQPLSVIDPRGPADELANRIRAGFRELLADRGADLAYGRTLPRRLREAGLTDVAADAYFPVTMPACAVLEAATVAMVGDDLVAHGVVGAEEIEVHLANVVAGRVDLAQPPLVAAWGRRPEGRT